MAVTPTLTEVLNRRGWASAPNEAPARSDATSTQHEQRAHAHSHHNDSGAWSGVRRQLLQANGGGGALANVPSGGRLMMPYEPQILVLFREPIARCRSAWMCGCATATPPNRHASPPP